MTAYLTCRGCRYDRLPCARRDSLTTNIRGFGITSVKFSCKERVNLYEPGDLVWATVAGETEFYGPDDPETVYRPFPAVVIQMLTTKAVVYIHPGSIASDDATGAHPFEPRGKGFCRVTLRHLARRSGPRETLCHDCGLPSSFGHQAGYACDPAFDEYSVAEKAS